MRCMNCINEVYMDKVGDGEWLCPVCGDFHYEYAELPPEAYMEIVHDCEWEGCKEEAYRHYQFETFDDSGGSKAVAMFLCWKHAEANGLCPVCGWHHGGGLCQQCIDENF